MSKTNIGNSLCPTLIPGEKCEKRKRFTPAFSANQVSKTSVTRLNDSKWHGYHKRITRSI